MNQPNGMGLEVDMSLSAMIGRNCDLMHQRYRAQQKQFEDLPSYIPFTQAGIIPASGALIIDVSLGAGPNLGYQWMVRRAGISDANSFTATMGGRPVLRGTSDGAGYGPAQPCGVAVHEPAQRRHLRSR
jgi:hypothetical protein